MTDQLPSKDQFTPEYIAEVVKQLESQGWRPDSRGDPECCDEASAAGAQIIEQQRVEIQRLREDLRRAESARVAILAENTHYKQVAADLRQFQVGDAVTYLGVDTKIAEVQTTLVLEGGTVVQPGMLKRRAAQPSRDLIDYGYAPGGYAITCFDCKEKAWDCDKRASVCKPCAEKRRDRATQPPGDG